MKCYVSVFYSLLNSFNLTLLLEERKNEKSGFSSV